MSKDTKAQFQSYWQSGRKREAIMLDLMEHPDWSIYCDKLSLHWEQIDAAQVPADFQPIVKSILS